MNLMHLALVLLFSVLTSAAAADGDAFQFGIVTPGNARHPDALIGLRAAVAEADRRNLAFVVSLGIRGRGESCSDEIFEERHAMLQNAEHGVVVSLTAADWAACRSRQISAAERLNQLRALFFNGEFSLGGTRLPLLRQSASPQFRSYSENVRWEFGGVLFATINLPSDNNHYVNDAGRNNEFEDRQVANRVWLQRLFRIATYQKLSGIVLFTDADPLLEPFPDSGRDGFADVRRQLKVLTLRFPGKVLIVSASQAPTGSRRPDRSSRIAWSGNTGHFSVAEGWAQLSFNPAHRTLFTVTPYATQALP